MGVSVGVGGDIGGVNFAAAFQAQPCTELKSLPGIHEQENAHEQHVNAAKGAMAMHQQTAIPEHSDRRCRHTNAGCDLEGKPVTKHKPQKRPENLSAIQRINRQDINTSRIKLMKYI